jgi:streptogrisin C
MRKFVSWAKRGLLVLAPTTFLVAMAAAAAGPSGNVSPALRAAMQRDLGLTSAQVSQYLKIERLSTTQEKQLAATQGRNFAGSWIERKANGDYRFVVATTSSQPQKGVAGVEYRSARHTLAALESSKAQLDQLQAQGVKAPTGVYGWLVDVRANSVTVNVAPGARKAAIDFVAASGADAGTIKFRTMGSAPKLLNTFKGGSEYLSYSGGSYWYCSVGFNVTRNGNQGWATAGHCGNAGDTVHYLVNRRTVSASIGSFQASSFPNGDKAWVQVNSSQTLLPVVSASGGDVGVAGSLEAAIGANVCRSGRTTGWHCGTIEAKNVTVQYPDESVSGLTQVHVCAEGGDSGGSFITTPGQAQGVLSGGNYSCKGKQASLATSFFQPINPILQSYGLTLMTN